MANTCQVDITNERNSESALFTDKEATSNATMNLMESSEERSGNKLMMEQFMKPKLKISPTTSLTLKAAPPLESPSNFVNMAPVIPISRLNAVTKAENSK